MTKPHPRPILPAALIAATVLALGGAFAWTAGLIGPHRLSGGAIADAMEANAGGPFKGYRRAHAKGLCLSGTFTASGAGLALADASVFRPGTYPVTGRFSVGGGNPLAGDGRNVFHAVGLILRTPDGQEWRTAMDHVPIFPVADPQAFEALQIAGTPDPKTGKPDPARMKAYLAAHPETQAFQDYMAKTPLPASFATATYYSINAFRFTTGGVTRFVRWQIVPEASGPALDKTKLAALPRDALFQEMVARTAGGPSRWHWQLVVANPGDVTDRATVAWTGPHRTIDAGVLTISAVAPEERGACRDLNFDPTILPPGIAISDDPLLPARSKVYSTSFTRRAGEHPGPSAIGQETPR
jgi:catalase